MFRCSRRDTVLSTHDPSFRSEWVSAPFCCVSGCWWQTSSLGARQCQCRGMQWHDIVCYHTNGNPPPKSNRPQITQTVSILGRSYGGMSKRLPGPNGEVVCRFILCGELQLCHRNGNVLWVIVGVQSDLCLLDLFCCATAISILIQLVFAKNNTLSVIYFKVNTCQESSS